jgi:hypothetical protein
VLPGDGGGWLAGGLRSGLFAGTHALLLTDVLFVIKRKTNGRGWGWGKL